MTADDTGVHSTWKDLGTIGCGAGRANGRCAKSAGRTTVRASNCQRRAGNWRRVTTAEPEVPAIRRPTPHAGELMSSPSWSRTEPTRLAHYILDPSVRPASHRFRYSNRSFA